MSEPKTKANEPNVAADGLTGRTRHVAGANGNHILQVEFGDPAQWRYATEHDLMRLGATKTTEPGQPPYLWFDPEDECACDLARTLSSDQLTDLFFDAIWREVMQQGKMDGMNARTDRDLSRYSIVVDGELDIRAIASAVAEEATAPAGDRITNG